MKGDGKRLVQVVCNAFKFTDPGGHIWLTVEAEADQVLLRVRDNGVGIDSSLLPHILEAFLQSTQALDRAKGGSGGSG